MTAQTTKPQGITVQGSGTNTYTIYQAKDGAWVCSCPAWKFQKGVSGANRRCKHIVKLSLSLGLHVEATS